MSLLQYLELNYFRKHVNLKLKINGNSGVILGQNGSGKSGIMQSIEYLLFGNVSGYKKEDLVNDTLPEKGKSYVTGILKLEGEFYRIERYVNSNKATIDKLECSTDVYGNMKEILNETNIATGLTGVTKFVSELLRIDNDKYCNLVYSRQGKLTEFIEARSSEKIALFDELIGLNKFSKLCDIMKEIKKNYKVIEDIGTIEENIRKYKEDLETNTIKFNSETNKESELEKELSNKSKLLSENLELKRIYEEKVNLENENKNISFKIETLEKTQKEIETKKNRMSQIKSDGEKLKEVTRKSIHDLDCIYYKINKNITKQTDSNEIKIKELKTAINHVNELNSKHSELKNKIETITKNINTFKNEIESEKKKLKELEKQTLDIESLNKDKENKLKEIESVKDEITTTQFKISLLEKVVVTTLDLCNCPLCKSKIDDSNINEMKEDFKIESEKNKTLKNKLVELTTECQKIVNSIKDAENILTEINLKKQSIKTYSDQLNKLTPEEKELTLEIKDIIVKLKSADDFNVLNEEMQKLHNENYKLNSKVKTLSNTNFSLTDEEMKKINVDKEIEINDLITKNRIDIDVLFKEFSSLKEEVSKFDEKEIENLKHKLKENLTKINNINNNNTLNPEEFENLIFQLTNDVGELKGQIQNYKNILSNLKSTIETYKKYIKDSEKIIDDNKNKIKKVEFIDKLIDLFSRDGLPQYIRNYVVKQLNNIINDYVNMFGFEFFTNNPVRINETTLEIEGLTKTSGGQDIIVALSLRIALNKLLTENLCFMILDEPTIFLDDKRIVMLKDIIEDFIFKNKTQILTVTHDKIFESIKNAKIFRIKSN